MTLETPGPLVPSAMQTPMLEFGSWEVKCRPRHIALYAEC